MDFKNGAPAPEEQEKEAGIYLNVNSKSPATTAPVYTTVVENFIVEKIKPNRDDKAAEHSHSRVLVILLWILCVLLVVSVCGNIYICVWMDIVKANLSSMTSEYQQLITERNVLENETAKLNWTLGVIMKFDNFPVTTYCPEKRISDCQLCQRDWILFQEKCYFFWEEEAPWKTWEESRTYCQNASADLAVIDSPQEQDFLSNHTKYYFDAIHGYWFGLKQSADQDWLWLDGRNVTLEYWKPDDFHGDCALMIPGQTASQPASWDPANCRMRNKIICEAEVLMWSN